MKELRDEEEIRNYVGREYQKIFASKPTSMSLDNYLTNNQTEDPPSMPKLSETAKKKLEKDITKWKSNKTKLPQELTGSL